MKKALIVFVMAFALSAFAASAADLSISLQVNTASKDYANNYLTITKPFG